ncbi:hypothetical protein [Streptomyces sp. Ag109_G2-15]|nr:hypothetical protein [Streptomyces sp. Ag109_G2-15]
MAATLFRTFPDQAQNLALERSAPYLRWRNTNALVWEGLSGDVALATVR